MDKLNTKILKSTSFRTPDVKVTSTSHILAVWSWGDDSDRRLAEKLPHIYTMDGDWFLLGEYPYWHKENAQETFNSLDNATDAIDFAFRNM